MTLFEYVVLSFLVGVAWLMCHEVGHYIVGVCLGYETHFHFCWDRIYVQCVGNLSMREADCVVLGGLLGILPTFLLSYFNWIVFGLACLFPFIYCLVELYENRLKLKKVSK